MIRVKTEITGGTSSKPHPEHKEKKFKYVSDIYDSMFFKTFHWIEKLSRIGITLTYDITISYHNEKELLERKIIISDFVKVSLFEA